MIAPCLKAGGTIGICSPSHIPLYEAAPGQEVKPSREYKNIISEMERQGFRVVTGENLYKDTWGYLASDTERAADLNQLAADSSVDLILFGGGEAGNELLPYVDFDLFRQHPKRMCSYSDGTTLLNAVWALTGLETYYGQNPVCFTEPTEYNRHHFQGHILSDDMTVHEKNSSWRALTPGKAEGVLVGGYTTNFCLLLGTKYFPVDLNEPHVLFLEDHEKFGGENHISAVLGHIEQSDFMKSCTGLLFGNFSDEPRPQLYARLQVLGERHHIPVVYCDDFGHGENHAILPIGRRAELDAEQAVLRYL
ncbi:MAG: LD-carboxypeptidase [Acutalibacter sp.]|nr:LD-carboxypeptidase [Acutalibacter sp.]